GTCDATLAVELEVDLRALDAQCSAREAPVAHLRRQTVGELERSNDRRLGLTPFGLPIGEPGLAPDDRAIEGRLPIRWHLDGDADPVLVQAQAAAILRKLGRKHRRDPARNVRRKRTFRCTAI